MTNKKLKMAAMSVALTACVAASPLAAKADAPEAAPGEPKTEPVAEETKKEENTAEPQVNQEAQDAQETLKDAEVKYNKDNPTTNPDGSQKLDGVIVTNPEGGETNPNPNPEGGKTDPDPNPNPDSGETNPNPNPNPDSGETNPNPEGGETNPNPDSGKTDPNPNPDPEGGKTDPEEKKLEEKKPEEKEPEEKKPEQIGTAEKTEKTETNVETKPNPGAEPIVDTTTPPTVEKNPDGSTTITQPTVTPGTETTTTTGTGTATGDLDTVVTETPKEKIDLEKELGKVNPDISWDVAKDADVGNGYTVQEVENDGNKQTLKLKKEDKTTAEMTAEDIAKLVDAEKPTVNPDGTYTLTRTETILDAEGNPQTRTTYITIRDNKVTTKTTTELTITRQKAEQDGSESFRDEVTYPSIQIKDGDKVVETIQPEDLEKMLKGTGADDGIHYTAPDGKEYVIQVGPESEGTPLSNAEIVDRLKKDGNKNYELGADGEIYYTTPHNETVKLDVTQNELLRRSLTYKVTLKTTTEGEKGTAGEQDATENARRDATRDALTKAVDKLGVDEATASQLKAKISGLTFKQEQLDKGDTFKVKLDDGKTYILTYSAAGVTVTSTPTEDKTDTGKKPEDITDVYDNTVTGKAYVTSGTISWTAKGQKGEYTATVGDASVLTPPEGATPEYKDGRLTGYKLTSTDNDGNTVTTTYTITYGNTSSMSPDELNRLAEQNLMEKTGCKTLEELAAAGYTNIRFDNASTVTWTVTQTTQIKTTNTETLNNKTLTFEGDKNWTIAEDGNTLTYDGKTYTKDEKGNFTRTDENDKNVTYTVTGQEEDDLSPEEAKEMLAKEFKVETSAIELNGTTATFTKDGAPVTVDCTNLKKRTLTIERSEAASVQKTVVVTDEATLNAAYEELWDEIKKKKDELGEDKTLFVGDIEVKDTGETVKKQVITYLKTAVTHADMTPEQLIAALNDQKELAKKTKVKVNEGTRFEETLDNYYSGKENFSHAYTPKLDIIGYTKGDYISHLDLASAAKLDLLPDADGKSETTDCVLVNPKLEWNYSAENLLADQSKLKEKDQNHNVGLDNKISYDEATGEEKGHFEYNRGDTNNHPKASAFYKVTGTVAYGKQGNAYKATPSGRDLFGNKYYTDEDYAAARGRAEAALAQYKKEYPDAQVVEICEDQNEYGGRYYQIYLYQSDLTAYGYMTRDANVCTNATAYKQIDSTKYFGGYDLMISRLVQTKEGKVVGETESKVKNIFAPLSIRTSTDYTHRSMKLTQMTTVTTQQTEEKRTDLGGSQETVKYLYDKSESVTPITEETKVEGHGTDHYKSFTNLIRNIFKGDGTGTKEGGFIKYVYHTEKDKEGNPVPFEAEQMVVTTKQDAEVHYTFTSQESRDVWIKGYTQTVVPPVNPGPDTPELPPVEDAKPAPAPAPAPETPVLPVVQDARPDPAPAPTPAPAPETPVLPAVQDAKLIQTGTSGWLADLMLGAGMVLSAAGYWMERKRKAMFYKSQH